MMVITRICGHQSFSLIKAKDTTRYHNVRKCSAVAEMGDRLATIDMGRKEGGLLYNMALAEIYLRTKWHLGPPSRLVRIDMSRNVGLCSFGGGSCVPI